MNQTLSALQAEVNKKLLALATLVVAAGLTSTATNRAVLYSTLTVLGNDSDVLVGIASSDNAASGATDRQCSEIKITSRSGNVMAYYDSSRPGAKLQMVDTPGITVFDYFNILKMLDTLTTAFAAGYPAAAITIPK